MQHEDGRFRRNKGQEIKTGQVWSDSYPQVPNLEYKKAQPYSLSPTLFQRLPHIFLPGISFSQSQCLSHTLTLLLRNEPQAFLVLMTHLDLSFFCFSQVSYQWISACILQTPQAYIFDWNWQYLWFSPQDWGILLSPLTVLGVIRRSRE